MFTRVDLSLLLACTATIAALVAAPAAHGAKQFQVVVFGDSFASGEGAPAVDGDYGPTGEDIGHLRSGRDQPHPHADWNGNSAQAAFTGDVASDARRCHRSPVATAPLAVGLLQRDFPDIGFTFRSFACSGARIEEGVTGSYKGAEPGDQDNRVPSQISQANAYLNATPMPAGHQRRIDALVMNVGGNNLGFANLIERCENIGVLYPLNPCNPRAFGGLGNDDALKVFETGEGSGESASVIGLDDVGGLYADLDKRIDRVSGTAGPLAVTPGEVYLSGPPNPLSGAFDGCLTGANDYEKNLQLSERNWLEQSILPRMVTAMRTHAGDRRWEFVDMSSRTPNGVCSGSARMFNRNRDALRAQGATIASDLNIAVSHGIAHPNRRGYVAMAPHLAEAMRSQVIDAFTPRAPQSGEVAPLVALGPRVQLRVGPAADDYATRPAAVTPAPRPGIAAGPTVAGPLGTGIGTVEVPVPGGLDAISMQTRRCGPVGPSVALPSGCGDPRSIRQVLVGTPGVPTGVRAEKQSGGVRVDWARSSAAATLRRFLVSAEDTDDRVHVAFSASADDRMMLLPLEAGRWFVDVRECTDRGCGSASPKVSVLSDGPNQITGRQQFESLEIGQPVGVFAMPSGRASRFGGRFARARAGGGFALKVAWATWSHWRDLKNVRLRLVGERGELGTIHVELGSGLVRLQAPSSPVRHGRIGRPGTLAARRFSLRTARARITGGGKRSRLVTLELPLKLSRSLGRQRVDVDIAASTKRGTRQAFGPAGSFEVR
jgi:hypothetical protein